jgi:hypothetical protein
MSGRSARRWVAGCEAEAHLADGTITGHDTLSQVSRGWQQSDECERTFKDWVAGAAIVYYRRVV